MGLGLFSNNRITRKNILECLSGFFDAGYKSLIEGLNETFEGKMEIDEDQKNELMAVSMLAVLEATSKTWGKIAEEKEIIGKKAREIISKKYFSDTAKFEKFDELFNKRSGEYHEVLQPENTELVIQFGQIFCAHFLNKNNIAEVEANSRNLAIMTLAGGSFINIMSEVKKFFDETMTKCVFDW